MDESQIRLAESFEGLLTNFAPADPWRFETDHFEEAIMEAKEQLNAVNNKYRDSELHQALLSLQDFMNTAIDTDACVGKIPLSDDAITSIAGERVALPIKEVVAASLYNKLDPSLVGVENRGDVMDTSIRRSHEAPAEQLTVSDKIASFDFPDELKKIHKCLCPSAVSIRVELYKLVLYGEGDFFVPHRDSMSSADMFGTISLQIPIIETGKESDKYSSDNSQNSGPEAGPLKPRNTKRSGQLVLYVGRQESDMKPHSSTQEGGGKYDTQHRFAYVVDMDTMGSATMENGVVNAPYGAWTGDVLHEVRRVDHGYRAVLIYKLYKQGHRDSYIPLALREKAMPQIARVIKALSETGPCFESTAFPQPLRYLGVILRHSYPRAGLRWDCLKGVDAVFYSMASATNRCLLFNAHDVVFEDMWSHHLAPRDIVTRLVFLTAGAAFTHFEIGDLDSLYKIPKRFRMFGSTAWMQLGYGTLAGGGMCYGNWDSGTEWWYRSAVMIVTPQPSGWKRCRDLLLAVNRGNVAMRRLRTNTDLLGKIASFL